MPATPPRILAILLGVIGLGCLLMFAAGPAAASPAPVCNGVHCFVTFTTAGVGQTWTAPPGVTSVGMQLYGAEGGSDATKAGGAGAKITGELTVHGGEVVTVDIGGTTSDWHGGANGGGDGGSTGVGGAGGGGMTDVRVGGVYQLIAAGGGGAGGTGGGVCGMPNPSLGGSGGTTEDHGEEGDNTTWITTTLSGGAYGDAGKTSGDSAGGAAGTADAATAGCVGESTATASGTAGGNGTADHGGGGVATAGGGGGAGAFGGGQGGSGASSAPGQADIHGEVAGSGGGGGGSSNGLAADFYQLVDTAGNAGLINHGTGEIFMVYAEATATTSAPPPSSSPASSPASSASTGASTAAGSTTAVSSAHASTAAGAPVASSSSAAASLAETGAQTATLGALSVALLVSGAGLIVLARRRYVRQH